jgi:K+ transporter
MPPSTVALRAGWICLLIVSVGILGFGVATASFSSDPLARADGVALTGMGLFGTVITVVPFRRRERWAWVVLWFYPLFWLAHLLGRLPPGKDHVHQVVFILLSLAGLLVPAGTFLGKESAARMKRVAN